MLWRVNQAGSLLRFRVLELDLFSPFSYLIIIKGLMPNVVASLYHDLLPGNPPEWSISGRLWITLFMSVLIPLSFLRRLDSLRYASYIAVFAAGEASSFVCMGDIYADLFDSLPSADCHCVLFPSIKGNSSYWTYLSDTFHS